MLFLKAFVALFCIIGFISADEIDLNASEEAFDGDDDHDNDYDGNRNISYMLDDMILTREQMDYLFTNGTRRNGVIDPNLKWPNKTVIVNVTDDFSEWKQK